VGERRAEGRAIGSALGQGNIEAAPAAAICGLQAELGQRRDRLGRQQRVNKLEEGIAASTEPAVQGGAKGAQGLEIMSGYTAQGARTSRRWHFRRSALSFGLHHQLSY
jgi:hypothetical protein